ncbi:unnamed protein product, partial [marine sediment metagenome]
DMSKWIGVRPRELDKSLDFFRKKGYITYEKIRGKYYFILFGEPVEELTLGDDPG